MASERPARRPAPRRRGRRKDAVGSELPGGVFWGFGILLPAGLVACGIYCLVTESFFLPIYRGHGFTASGRTADGLGVFAFGLALLAHSAGFWRIFPPFRRIGTVGLIIGAFVAAAGYLVAFA